MIKPLSFLISILLIIVYVGCGKKNAEKHKEESLQQSEAPQIIVSGKPSGLEKYYNSPEFKECYNEPVSPPQMNLNVDLSSKSLAELRIIRNEIYARHGFLFMDMVLRGHFVQFPWYQPIFWDSLFKVTLTKEEAAFVDNVSKKEQVLLNENYIQVNGRHMSNYRNVVNAIEFKEIPDTLVSLLKKNGFAMVKSDRHQLFHVYDENQYEAIPHFVTTDLYLQLLHVYYSNMLRKIEINKLAPTLKAALEKLQNSAVQFYDDNKNDNKLLKDALKFNAVYFSVARAIVDEKTFYVPQDLKEDVQEELARVNAKQGRGSPFLKSNIFDYTQLQPRGYYASDSTLNMYFICLRWLELAPLFISDDNGLASAIVGAYLLQKENGKTIPEYCSIDGAARLLVGEPNNLSLTDIIQIEHGSLSQEKLNSLFEPAKFNELKTRLKSINNSRIVQRGASKIAHDELNKIPLHFMSARYTFDGEILQRLVDISNPEPKRAFPKGLDIFAVFGNKEAEDILLQECKENQKWPFYSDTLNFLKKKFSSSMRWNQNVYNKRMQSVLSIMYVEPSFPVFMQTPEWQRRCLNTALAGWTHLKHETVLYTFPPGGAECGEGGCAPPPNTIGYVEPNIEFWKNCNSLLDLTFKGLQEIGCGDTNVIKLGEKIRQSIGIMGRISEKELSKKPLTKEEFDEIHFIGGEIEQLTMEALDAQIIDDTPDRKMPVTSDVYTYNSECLQEATGYGNEIYVIVEINGLLYITRGAVLSYYEFIKNTSDRLTDDGWQKRLESGNTPEPPVWLKNLFAPVKTLETKPTYNSLLPSGC
jgi:hypothetical protein